MFNPTNDVDNFVVTQGISYTNSFMQSCGCVSRPFGLRPKRIRIVRGGTIFFSPGDHYAILRILCHHTTLPSHALNTLVTALVHSRLDQCSRIRILCFFQISKKHDFLRFFEMTYQKVVKSLYQKFSLQSVKMSSIFIYFVQ